MKAASLSLSLATVALSLSACATAKLDMSTTAPTPDRRVGLRAGEMNAGEATWNLRVVSKTRPSEKFAGVTNSDRTSLAKAPGTINANSHTLSLTNANVDAPVGSIGRGTPGRCLRQGS